MARLRTNWKNNMRIYDACSHMKQAIANMNNWREKETTRAEMAKIIRDTLWHSLPTSYTDADMTNCRQKIYTFIVERSPYDSGCMGIRLVFMTNAIRGSKHSFACCPFAVMPLHRAFLSVRGNSESL